MSSVLTLRGEVFVGNLDPYDPDNPAADPSVISNAMTSLGNISKFTIEPSLERVKVQEWQTGNDGVAQSWTRGSGGKIKMMAETSNSFNLALSLAGNIRQVGPESVTAAKIAVKDTTTGKWSELTAATALMADTNYKFVKTISDDGLSYDAYENIDPATFVLTDSSVAPKTLTVTTDYTLNGRWGNLKLKGGAGVGINLTGLTYPLMASFDVGLFTDTIPTPITQGRPYGLSYKNLKSAVLKDSSATPKIIPDTHYTVDAEYGMLTITNAAAIKLISGITFPLKVVATRGTVKSVGLLSKDDVDKQVRLNGINARNGNKITVTLYKVSFDTSAIDFFDKDYAKTPLEGEIMADPSKPKDDVLGQFGKIEYL